MIYMLTGCVLRLDELKLLVVLMDCWFAGSYHCLPALTSAVRLPDWTLTQKPLLLANGIDGPKRGRNDCKTYHKTFKLAWEMFSNVGENYL